MRRAAIILQVVAVLRDAESRNGTHGKCIATVDAQHVRV